MCRRIFFNFLIFFGLRFDSKYECVFFFHIFFVLTILKSSVMTPEQSEVKFKSVSTPVQRQDGIVLRSYASLEDLKPIIDMMERDLSGFGCKKRFFFFFLNDSSEPYSIFTYRYFVQDWPDLTWLAIDKGKIIGSVVCEVKMRKKMLRGYIAMLSVEPEYRRRGIAQDLVMQALLVMKEAGCYMATLETEVINVKATSLYTKLGFQKDKVKKKANLFFLKKNFNKTQLLLRYYLNGGDAWRLKLMFGTPNQTAAAAAAAKIKE